MLYALLFSFFFLPPSIACKVSPRINSTYIEFLLLLLVVVVVVVVDDGNKKNTQKVCYTVERERKGEISQIPRP